MIGLVATTFTWQCSHEVVDYVDVVVYHVATGEQVLAVHQGRAVAARINPLKQKCKWSEPEFIVVSCRCKRAT